MLSEKRTFQGREMQYEDPAWGAYRAASMGIMAPVLESRLNRFSNMGLSTMSSAPTYRCGNQRSLPKVATATVSVPSGGTAGAGATPTVQVRTTTINPMHHRH